MDSPRGKSSLSARLRAWRASVGSAIAGRPAGQFAAMASEPLVDDAAAYAALPARAPRADVAYAAAASSGGAARDSAAWSVETPGASRRAPPPPLDAGAQLAQLSAAARTAAALGWDVCAAVAPQERDVLLGDDLRGVAAALRGCVAAAAAQGSASEPTLADAFAALDELG
jgi:hypothetical protein